ncbi:NADPH-dependent FMN reductase [Variovorax sp. Sphag1AA]|uniref:NADPH-dependent FMN reductase n=1 Tax=Variovorax sp. Sphag1AA TaxID=2587027 RepID=UPI00161DA42C|nr:NAD(P)H-dependent oxidoreductase [Variovorax sp. Sphag1AA]MBB3181756.1 NAD(P)H-dependent FMN reductase [Variovorax sp. Sphag1AA]
MTQPILHTLICSTRPGRVGPGVAEWAHAAAVAHGGFDARLVDLASFGLPVFDEPEHPRLGRYVHEHTKAWSASVNAADAFLFVLPEYNYGPPGALINALNYLVREWQYKAVGFVSYGGVSGGMRSVQVTKGLLTTLKMVPMLEAVAIPFVAQQLQAEGGIAANAVHGAAATAMLDELLRWTKALQGLRA